MVFNRLRCWLVARKFPDYRPQPVTTASVMEWLRPHNKADRKALLRILDSLKYLTEEETKNTLVNLNSALLRRLNGSGVPAKDVIYVQVHDAGSSSPVMLNLLKDFAHLQRLGCKLIDSKDATGFDSLFKAMDAGAVVYVDDFAGTGNQFCSVRDVLAPLIPTTFVEFVIMPGMCEEAYRRISQRGIEAYTGFIHSKADRPLDESSSILDGETRSRLRRLCGNVFPPAGLGYERIASHVVFYRNAPNTIPAILRGSRNQQPFPGLFPRTDDFLPEVFAHASSPKAKAELFKVREEAANALNLSKKTDRRESQGEKMG
jgi:hypothetical protein